MATTAEALRLAEASDWKGLQRLVERRPEAARARGEYGMLPLHWACTEPRVPLALLRRLLAAHPAGARARNAAELLPLHIAIRAGAPAAWLARLAAAFPPALRARVPSGETAVELAEAMRLDAGRLKVLYRAERELSPEADGDGSEDGGGRDELEGENDVVDASDEDEGRGVGSARKSVGSRGSYTKKVRTESEDEDADADEDEPAWPAPYVGNGGGSTRLSAATELSDVQVVEDALSSGSSLSEGAVRLSASRDLLVSPSSASSASQGLSPPNSVSAPVPLSSALAGAYGRRHSHGRGYATGDASSRDAARDADRPKAQSLAATPMGGRHQSLPIIPSLDTTRRNSVGAFADPAGFEYASGSDDSDFGPAAGRGYFHSQPSQPSQQQPPALHGQRAFQTQPHAAKQRHHSPFAYRRASHGEAALLLATGTGGTALGSGSLSAGVHRRGGSGGAFESPPEWRLDDECAICRATFNMFKHRHHCRNCGKSICRQHSADKKVSMAAKGFSTPQRVCISCFAMMAQSRELQRELAIGDLAGEGLLNPVAFQQQHYAAGSVGSSAPGLRSTAMSSGGTGPTRRSSLRVSLVTGSSPSGSNAVAGTAASASGTAMPAGAATDSGAPPATSREAALAGQVQELRALVGDQQRQLEQLAQSNAQLQLQLLEHEEEKAETTLLITQLMTRVSALELRRGRDEDGEDADEDEREDEREDEDEDEDEQPEDGSRRAPAARGA